MPKIDMAGIPARKGGRYPEPFREVTALREKQALGDAAGLTQFGVNLARMPPGASSALRHWHEAEDEFIYMLEGELVLVENEGETLLKAGDAAGFKANVPNGHYLVNRSQRDALYLEVGTRAERDLVHYSDVDMINERGIGHYRFRHKSGEDYPDGRSA
jgi:uncharacterized cupin superfamily protein